MRTKPEYITIEDLSIKNMLENDASTELHKYIQDSKFRYFFDKTKFKSKIYRIQIRIADRFFASSKTCCICGWKNKNLKLSDIVFKCKGCNNVMDRDVNSSYNLLDLKKKYYTVYT